ncbi:MAG: PhzF family phenazine biosynthesis protein, partial [Bacillota bacterium]|nr:PhzF family phenazine biosynthesis protein [Bacillota bacterium]
FMRRLAAELKHSETAYVKQLSPDAFRIRYFTPVEEVDLCGHATIAAFSTLRNEHLISPGYFSLSTRAGELSIRVQEDCIWMDMASPRELRILTEEESLALYQAYGLDLSHQPTGFIPKVISTGLSDILLPVNSKKALKEAVQQADAVSRLSRAYDSVGFHLFYYNENDTDGVKAYCRNFAPLYGIEEESATGTANGALTYYLYGYGNIEPAVENIFIQGEDMGRPSIIKSQLYVEGDQVLIRIGGSSVISMKGQLWS